jgi:hypothetical protein
MMRFWNNRKLKKKTFGAGKPKGLKRMVTCVPLSGGREHEY